MTTTTDKTNNNIMENRYIYKVYFVNGCTYIGKHTENKENDGYITSSSYYKKHKDLYERREILIEHLPDDDVLDIMETLCIFHDICESPYNVNYNKGAWMNNSKFDRGFKGPTNGMYGKHFSSETKLKMSKAWTEERRKKYHAKRAGVKRPGNIKMNKSKEHIEAVKRGRERFMRKHCFRCIYGENIIIDYDSWVKLGKEYHKFKKELYTNQQIMPLEEYNDWYNKFIEHSKHGDRVYKTGLRPFENKHWYNNGIIEIAAFECPNGFTKGRLKFSKEWHANNKAAMQRRVQNGGNRHNLGKKAWNSGKKIGPNTKLQKPVMNTETGATYNSVKDCREQENLSRTKFYKEKKNGKYIFIGK